VVLCIVDDLLKILGGDDDNGADFCGESHAQQFLFFFATNIIIFYY
jgi:hypothetical protein